MSSPQITRMFGLSCGIRRLLLRRRGLGCAHDAAEAEVAVDVSIVCACRAAGPVAQAVVRRAEVRAALDHPARDLLAGLVRVEARVGDVTRGFAGTQHGLATSSGWRGVYQSVVHSQTLPVMS